MSASIDQQRDDDMPTEIDFSGGERGKFFKPSADLRLPIYLDNSVELYLSKKANAKGVELSVLVNELLKKEIEIIESIK